MVKTAYTFDDLLLVPQRGILDYRKQAETYTQITPKIKLNIPLISMSMDTVTEDEMAIEMAKYGGMGILHRNNTIEQQVEMVKKVKSYSLEEIVKYKKATVDSQGRLLVAGAVGMRDESYMKRAEELLKEGCDLIVMDIPHGHMNKSIKCLERIKSNLETEVLIGNVATYEGFKELAEAGADAIKIGIGNGTICKTRIMTGFGVPQMTALFDCYQASKETGVYMISEGGTRNPGDIVKCLAAGSSAVIIGSQFAATKESPGEIIIEKGEEYKLYYGLASNLAKEKELGKRLEELTEEELDNLPVDEGVPSLVKYKGPVRNKIREIVGGIKSAISFAGEKKLSDFIGTCSLGNGRFILQTSAGLAESNPHTVLELSKKSVKEIAKQESKIN